MEKITEKQTEVGTVMSEISGRPLPQMDARVIEVYKGVSKVSWDPQCVCCLLWSCCEEHSVGLLTRFCTWMGFLFVLSYKAISKSLKNVG